MDITLIEDKLWNLKYSLIKCSIDIIEYYMADLIKLDRTLFPSRWTDIEFRKDLPGKWEFSYLVLDNKVLVAFIIASIKATGLHIHRLGIEYSFQNQGLGSKLIYIIQKQALLKNLNSLSLKVHKSNTRAINFYTRMGFLLENFSGDNYIMTKDLTKDVSNNP
jgi:ribosomal protein S18 acetylase RimI-like enzyme